MRMWMRMWDWEGMFTLKDVFLKGGSFVVRQMFLRFRWWVYGVHDYATGVWSDRRLLSWVWTDRDCCRLQCKRSVQYSNLLYIRLLPKSTYIILPQHKTIHFVQYQPTTKTYPLCRPKNTPHNMIHVTYAWPPGPRKASNRHWDCNEPGTGGDRLNGRYDWIFHVTRSES